MTVVVMPESKIQKALIQKWLSELPEDIPLDKLEKFIERLQIIHRIEEGRKDIREGRGISQEEGLKKLRQWSR